MGQPDCPAAVLGFLPTHALLCFHLSTATAGFFQTNEISFAEFCVRFIDGYLNVLMDYKLRFSCDYDFCKYRRLLFVTILHIGSVKF
jgi:hypothetical protein